MNMGIHDALNLGWKLAFAVQAEGPVRELLNSYELERRRADRRVLWITPDGYVGYRSNAVNQSEIERWLRSVGVAPLA
jgi:2-polyprenyl-6-methoxyphenol hydroxylase-like FAD-dependent oxidoreductase